MSIYVIETPHQGAPFCWVADDEQGFIGLADSGTKGEPLPEDATFADAWQYLSASLRDLTMFESTDDAADYLLRGWHGSTPIGRSALATQVNYRIGEITDHATRLRVLGMMWNERRECEREIAGDVYDAVRFAAQSMTEVDMACALGVNRMTVRRALGKR